MITGFLKDNCVEPTTGSRNNIGRISAPGLDSTAGEKVEIDDA